MHTLRMFINKLYTYTSWQLASIKEILGHTSLYPNSNWDDSICGFLNGCLLKLSTLCNHSNQVPHFIKINSVKVSISLPQRKNLQNLKTLSKQILHNNFFFIFLEAYNEKPSNNQSFFPTHFHFWHRQIDLDQKKLKETHSLYENQ